MTHAAQRHYDGKRWDKLIDEHHKSVKRPPIMIIIDEESNMTEEQWKYAAAWGKRNASLL